MSSFISKPGAGSSGSGGGVAIGGDLGGSSSSPIVTAIQGNSISSNVPSDGHVLTWVGEGGGWLPLFPSSYFGSQDIITTGTGYFSYVNATEGSIVTINSTDIYASHRLYTPSIDTSTAAQLSIGSTNATSISIGKGGSAITIPGNLTVNGTTTTVNSTSLSISDRIIHSYAISGPSPVPSAIAGLSVDRGETDGYVKRDSAGVYWDESILAWRFAYNTSRDGYTIGASLPLVVSNITLNSLSTGILHSNSSGILTSSQIVDSDISASANISGSKIGTITINGDVTGTTSATTVTKIQGRSIKSTTPTDGYALVWGSSDGYWQAKGLNGAVTGSLQSNRLVLIDGYASTGIVNVTATSSTWNSKMTTSQFTPVTTTSTASTTIATIPIIDNAVSSIDIIVQGKKASATDSFRQNFSLDYSRSGGGSPTAGSNPVTTPSTIGTASAWSVSYTISGNNLLVLAVGANSTTIQWHVTSQVTIAT
jgi:hypothetical protein